MKIYIGLQGSTYCSTAEKPGMCNPVQITSVILTVSNKAWYQPTHDKTRKGYLPSNQG